MDIYGRSELPDSLQSDLDLILFCFLWNRENITVLTKYKLFSKLAESLILKRFIGVQSFGKSSLVSGFNNALLSDTVFLLECYLRIVLPKKWLFHFYSLTFYCPSGRVFHFQNFVHCPVQALIVA